jgi:hypothetical protein
MSPSCHWNWVIIGTVLHPIRLLLQDKTSEHMVTCKYQMSSWTEAMLYGLGQVCTPVLTSFSLQVCRFLPLLLQKTPLVICWSLCKLPISGAEEDPRIWRMLSKCAITELHSWFVQAFYSIDHRIRKEIDYLLCLPFLWLPFYGKKTQIHVCT